MLKYAAANLETGGGSLGQAMTAARAPRRATDPAGRIGLNWFIDRLGRRELVWHNGATTGFVSFLGIDEARRTAVVVLGNSQSDGVDDIGFHIVAVAEPVGGSAARGRAGSCALADSVAP